MGKRPWSSGMRSAGLLTWKAPAAMNRTWSVFTGPYLVVTVLPSTMGRMSRCTPSRLTSGPPPRAAPSRLAILSISSMKMIPLDSARSSASRLTRSWSTSRPASSWARRSSASGTVTLRAPGAGHAGHGAEQLGEVDADLLHPLPGEVAEEGGPGVGDVDLHRPVVEGAGAELGPELLALGVAEASGRRGRGGEAHRPGAAAWGCRGRAARPAGPRRPRGPGSGPWPSPPRGPGRWRPRPGRGPSTRRRGRRSPPR